MATYTAQMTLFMFVDIFLFIMQHDISMYNMLTHTTGVNDIQSFVTLALTTSAGGEGDLVHDKLSHLQTVGIGFASFIYNIKDTDGFFELKEKCSSVWEALKSNDKLPQLLVSHEIFSRLHVHIITLYAALLICRKPIPLSRQPFVLKLHVFLIV